LASDVALRDVPGMVAENAVEMKARREQRWRG